MLHGIAAAAVALSMVVAVVPARSSAHQLEMSEAWLHVDPGVVRLELLLDLERLVTGPDPNDLQPDGYARLFTLSGAERDAAWRPIRDYFASSVPILADGRALEVTVTMPEIDRAPGEVRRGKTTVVLTAKLDGATTVGFRTTPELGTVVFNSYVGPEPREQNLPVRPGETPPPVTLDQASAPSSTLAVVGRYLVLGFEHIVPKGADHILFVLGLCLLSWRVRPLLAQVSAFTLAHTITLALAVTGVVSVSPSIVEPLIALSIVAVAVENLFATEARWWRVAIVFAFGLLHGLGFAGVLSELGLPQGQLAAALISFNVGVELGQLAVILAAFVLVGSWSRGKPWERARVRIPASVAVAAVGLLWAVERVLG
jgi:hydrogenase/urease accessory protein HupE